MIRYDTVAVQGCVRPSRVLVDSVPHVAWCCFVSAALRQRSSNMSETPNFVSRGGRLCMRRCLSRNVFSLLAFVTVALLHYCRSSEEPRWQSASVEQLFYRKLSGNLTIKEDPCERRGYVKPIYTSLGLNNYKMELRLAAMLAKQLDRCLCLIPLIEGRTVGSSLEVPVSQIYDVSKLSSYVHVKDGCADARPVYRVKCKAQRKLIPVEPELVVFQALRDARIVLSDSCLLMSKEGAYFDQSWQLWHSLEKPREIQVASRQFIAQHFGSQPFVSFHWRFEEHKCAVAGGVIGLCFRTHRGVMKADKRAIVSAVIATAAGRPVFLATDGRARGYDSLVEEVKREISKELLIVEVTSYDYNVPLSSELEQQICILSEVHIGSSISSWDWEVMYSTFSMRDEPDLFHSVVMLEEKIDPSRSSLNHTNRVQFIDVILQNRLDANESR